MDIYDFLESLPQSMDKTRTRTILGPTCLLPYIETKESPTTDTILELIRDTPSNIFSGHISSVPEWTKDITCAKVVKSFHKCLSMSQVARASKMDRSQIEPILNTLKMIGNGFNASYSRTTRRGKHNEGDQPEDLEMVIHETTNVSSEHKANSSQSAKSPIAMNKGGNDEDITSESKMRVAQHEENFILREYIAYLESVLKSRDSEYGVVQNHMRRMIEMCDARFPAE